MRTAAHFAEISKEKKNFIFAIESPYEKDIRERDEN
jgi:hypothetical protein